MSIKIIGLTGQTGAGKSTVANLLREKGCCVIDGDVAAREVVRAGSPVLARLAEVFGSDIILPDGELDRRLLASRAFSLKENTDKLNEITHPAITQLITDELREAEADGFKTAVIDAAALFESELADICSVFVVVTAPLETRLERIIKRDSISEDEALRRINAQPDEEYYRQRADVVIFNAPPVSLESEMEKLTPFIA